MSKSKDFVKEYVSSKRDEIFKDLFDMIRLRSVLGESRPEMPFGPGPAESLNFAADLFRKHGWDVDLHADRGYAVVKVNSGPKRFGVFTHCDVVGENGRWAFGAPFEPSFYKGLIVGRGAKDDKGAVIASLYAIDALRAAGIQLKNDVFIYLGSNEESGMKDLRNYLADNGQPDLGLVPDCENAICRGEKSLCGFYLNCTIPFENIIDFSGGDVPNAVIPEFSAVLPNLPELRGQIEENLRCRTDASLSEDADGHLLLHTKGISTHAAAPEGSVNAAAVAADILRRCSALGANDTALMQYVYDMLKDYCGDFFNIAYEDSDFKMLTTISGVIKTVDGKLSIHQRCCYNTAVSYDWIEWNVRAKVEPDGWQYVFEMDSTGVLYPFDDPYVSRLNQLYNETADGPAQGIYTTRGGTYARQLKYAFACGIDAPKTVFPPEYTLGQGKPHQPDECVGADNLIGGIALLALYIAEMDNILAGTD